MHNSSFTIICSCWLACTLRQFSILNFQLSLTLGIGREGEPYEGIGRGPLNIAGLPVYRDALGGIGTPTSDHERTKLSLQTTQLLAIVNGYDGNRDNVNACARFIQELLVRYAHSDGGVTIGF